MHSVHFYSSLSLKVMGFVSWLMQQRTCVFICTVFVFFLSFSCVFSVLHAIIYTRSF